MATDGEPREPHDHRRSSSACKAAGSSAPSDAIKSSPMAPVAFDVLRLFGFARTWVERLGVGIFTHKAADAHLEAAPEALIRRFERALAAPVDAAARGEPQPAA
jgi:hypothetical protein